MGNGARVNHQEVPLSPDAVALGRCRTMALKTVQEIDARFPEGTNDVDEVVNRGLRIFYRGQVDQALNNIESAIGSGKATNEMCERLVRAMTQEVFGILRSISPETHRSEFPE